MFFSDKRVPPFEEVNKGSGFSALAIIVPKFFVSELTSCGGSQILRSSGCRVFHWLLNQIVYTIEGTTSYNISIQPHGLKS